MQTSISGLLLRAVRSRLTGVAVTALAALAMVVHGLAAPAMAAINPQIEVSDLSLTKVNAANEEQSGELYVQGLALLTFNWDASKITPKEGDSFAISLPAEFKFHSTFAVPMKYDDQTVGQCTVAGDTLTCAFDAGITPLVQAGNKDIRGTGKFQLGVVSHTSKEELPFIINRDKTVNVDLPGTGGIPKSTSSYRPDIQFYKSYVGVMKEGDTETNWYFNFGGPTFMKALGVTFDGQTEQTITFKDTLGAGMTCPMTSIHLTAIESEENPSQWVLLDKGPEAGATTGAQGTFEVTGECEQMAADGTTPITIVAKGPFRAKTNYSISYKTLFVGGTALPGTDYTNTIVVDGTKFRWQKTTNFTVAGSVEVEMRQGEGTFSVIKTIASDYLQHVDADVSFKVTFDYELPAGTTVDNYPKWTPPTNEDQSSTLNSDKRTGTASMVVKRGQETSFATPFPMGTTITNLREDTSTANPTLPAGYVWKDPKFTIGTGAGTSLTIEDQKTTKVNLLNTVGAADNGFQVIKKASGAEGADAKKYSFTYTCTLPDKTEKKGQITDVLGNSTPVSSPEKFPVGTTCEVTEDTAVAGIDGYTLDPTGHDVQTVTIGLVSEPTVAATFTNTYTLNKGSFSVKKVTEGAAFTGADNTFNVQYACTHDSVALTEEQKAGTLTLTGNGTAVQSPSLPFGTSCTIKENADTAQRAGYAVATAYSAGQVTVATATPNPEVTVTNTYTPLKGGFVISKTVDGDGAELAKDARFTFDYTCTPTSGVAQVKGTVVVKGGENHAVSDVPVGSCSVSERDATINGASLSTVLTVDGSANGVNNGTAVFNVLDSATVKVAATNTYVRDRGSFSVAKAVVGGQDSFVQDTFVFDYVCADGTEGHLDVPGDGTIVEGPRVPTGTTCTLSERAQTANRDGYTVASELSNDGKVTITDKDVVVAVKATNTYTPVPTPKLPAKPLAKTGASNVVVVAIVVSLLVGAGGALIAMKRRRRDL